MREISINEDESALLYDLMDQMDPLDTDAGTSVSDKTYDAGFINVPSKDQDFLLLIPVTRELESDVAIVEYTEKSRELLYEALNSSRCIISFSDIVFTSTSEEILGNFPNFTLGKPRFGQSKDGIVMNVAIKADTSSPKTIVQFLSKLYNVLKDEIVSDPSNQIVTAILPKTVSGTSWETLNPKYMFRLDYSLVKFVKTGGEEINPFLPNYLTCTYGIIYNIVNTFCPDSIMEARDSILAAYPNFNLGTVLKETAYDAKQVSSLSEITLPESFDNQVTEELTINMKVSQPDTRKYRYDVEVIVEPLYRDVQNILGNGLTPLGWEVLKSYPGAAARCYLRDRLILWFNEGNRCRLRSVTMKWRVIGAILFLNVFIVPETVYIADINDMIDCCICLKMDVHERESNTTDFFIEEFIDNINEDIFEGMLPKEILLETLIADRLDKIRI